MNKKILSNLVYYYFKFEEIQNSKFFINNYKLFLNYLIFFYLEKKKFKIFFRIA